MFFLFLLGLNLQKIYVYIRRAKWICCCRLNCTANFVSVLQTRCSSFSERFYFLKQRVNTTQPRVTSFRLRFAALGFNTWVLSWLLLFSGSKDSQQLRLFGLAFSNFLQVVFFLWSAAKVESVETFPSRLRNRSQRDRNFVAVKTGMRITFLNACVFQQKC